MDYIPKNIPTESWYIKDNIDSKEGFKRYTSYEVYKDMLLFLCGVGCRFGDMVKMKVSNLQFDDSTPREETMKQVEKCLLFSIWRKVKPTNKSEFQ